MTGLKLTVMLPQLYENVLVVPRDLKKWSLKGIKSSTGQPISFQGVENFGVAPGFVSFDWN